MSRVLLALLLFCSPAAAQVAVPALNARVTDLTGTLSAEQKTSLESRLESFERDKGAQIAVLIVPTIKPESIEQYSLRVVEAWKLGREGVDDGALLIVAKDDRELRIEVGYGLEGVVPDAVANRIIEDIIVPHFRAGNFYAGIDAGITQMIRVVSGEPLPQPREWRDQRSATFGAGGFVPAFLFVLLTGQILARVFGRLGGGLITSAGAGLIVWFLMASIPFALLAAVLAFMFSLFSGAASGRSYDSRGGWHHGGGWGGGDFSGGGLSGGGGFSGGGGSFGGGGASGRW
ncbi:MAG: TPM domain-containing protein [Burkholderiales bacterium]